MIEKEKNDFFALYFPCLDKNKLIFASTSGFIVLTNIMLKHSSIDILYFQLFLTKYQKSWTFICIFIDTEVNFTFSTSKFCFSFTFFHLTPLGIRNIDKNWPIIVYVKLFLIWNVVGPHFLMIWSSFLCIRFIRGIDASTITCKQRSNYRKKIEVSMLTSKLMI